MQVDPEAGHQPGINVARMPGKQPTIDPGFDESAKPLWSLYAKEVKEGDQALMDSITKDMDSLLLFVRSLFFSLYLV